PERRPYDAAARRQVPAADVRLHLLPDAGAHGQILARTDVVLHVQPELALRDRHVRVADIPGERRGPPSGVRVEAGKRERAGGVPQLARAVAAGVELHAGADGVAAGRYVEV